MTSQGAEPGARSWLFVPGDRPDRFAQAARSGADEVICDLEDSVAAEGKVQARRHVAQWLAQGGSAWVRVNACSTPYYERDVEALAGLAGLRGMVVPKAENPAALAALGRRLRPGTGILALIETAVGVLRAPAIARCRAVSQLAFGSIDFASDIDAAHDDEALLTARAALVIASRAAGKPAPVAVTREFRPGEEEIAWAREITAPDPPAVPRQAVSSLPLAGLVVVALEHAVAAPFATRQLADLGARVIKVERPGGGDFARGYDRSVLGQASYFVWLNRGKESVELDVKSPAGQAALAALLARADVFVQNLAPGAAGRLGLGADQLRARHPRLICCSVSGYGPDGPYARKKAYDLLVQCEAGLLSVTGTPDQPCKAGISVADIAADMYAYSGVLTALYERERTGSGSSFDVAMLDALGEWMGQPYYYTVYGEHDARRTGARHASISPYGSYLGGQVFLGLQNDREWATFCERVLGRPDLVTDERFATNPDRVAHDDELTLIIEAALGSMTPDEVVARLDEVGIASARLRTPSEFAAHPQLAARDRWREVQTPAGPIRALLPPVSVPGREAAMGAVPALGQHTDAVMAEFQVAPLR